ncbi:MAG: preprotein translocase subunit SecE [bacterium]|nr:preprotein translocase subunit SecE [bacterium]
MFQKIITFLKESRMELKKVTWPTREETIRYTGAVVAISLAVAVVLGGADFIFKALLTRFVI